jgi:hypothetical protein
VSPHTVLLAALKQSETRVIGLGHKARTGKDVAASYLAERVPGARAYAFSDAIAVVCRALYGMTTREPRLLQAVGIEARTKNPEVWVDALFWKIQEDAPSLAIVTGVRFQNEAEMIHAVSGEVWRIDRLNADGSMFVADDRPPDHPTETALDGFPFHRVIVNRTGQLERFRDAIHRAYLECAGE